MNKNQIEYYIGDIGYLVNDLIESKEKRKEILTHLREFSNSGNTEKAISYLADELVLPVVQVFFINSHDKEQIAVTCDSENYINSVRIQNFDYTGEGIVLFTRPDEEDDIETEMFCDILSEDCAIFYASDYIDTTVKNDIIIISDNKTGSEFTIG